VGPGTLFDGGERILGRITDGTYNTLAIIEDGQNPVEWTRPSDISIDDAIVALTPEDPKNFPHVEDSTFVTTYAPGIAAFYDGSTLDGYRFGGSAPKLLQNMLQINDGNVINWDDFVSRVSHVEPKYRPRVAAILFMLMMVYPLVWVFLGDRQRAEPKRNALEKDT